METLAIIGARSGSKGLPGKNVRLLAGKPLLSYAIETACECSNVNRVVFSTDSEEYASLARQFGAETPFLRPTELATDTSVDIQYVRHAVEWLDEHEGYRPEIVVRLCPTAPLIRSEDVDRIVQILADDPQAESAILMTEAREHPRKSVRIAPDGHHAVSYVTERGADVAPSNRQGYVPAFNRQGLPVASRLRTILEKNSQTGDIVRYHLVPLETTLDVDTMLDFRIIEMILRDGVAAPPRVGP